MMIKFNLNIFTLDKPIELFGEDDNSVNRFDGENRYSIISKTLDLYKPDSSIHRYPEDHSVQV